MKALVEVLLSLPQVCRVLLAANHLTDGAVEELVTGFFNTQFGACIQTLDVSHNLLTAGAVSQLLPLLQMDTPLHVSND